MTDDKAVTIGALAKEFGLSVRTLHHYDAVGLLTAHRTDSGRRVYGPEARLRLVGILIRREMGFSLEEIRKSFRQKNDEARRALDAHIVNLKEALAIQEARCRRAEKLAKMWDASEPMRRRLTETPGAKKALLDERAEIYAKLAEYRTQGLAPGDERVQALVRRHITLAEGMFGGRDAARAYLDKVRETMRSAPGQTNPAIGRYFETHVWPDSADRAFLLAAIRIAAHVPGNAPGNAPGNRVS